MLYGWTGTVVFLLPCVAFAQAPVSLHASYQTYAAGLEVAEVEAGFSFGPWTYQMSLGYKTTGMVGLFFSGHQLDHVNGSWRGRLAEPSQYVGEGTWHGTNRLAQIDYQQGKPSIRQLVPTNLDEREPVPEALQANTTDTLSALVDLIRSVDATGRCETTVRTFDGRRSIEIEAHTVGEEVVEPTSRSIYAGKALRCDFSGRMLAGFLLKDNHPHEARPMHGSAWLAPVVLGGPPLPVRMTFETRWFGDATMYLTATGPGANIKIAQGN